MVYCTPFSFENSHKNCFSKADGQAQKPETTPLFETPTTPHPGGPAAQVVVVKVQEAKQHKYVVKDQEVPQHR